MIWISLKKIATKAISSLGKHPQICIHLDPKKGQHAMKGLQGLKVIFHHKK